MTNSKYSKLNIELIVLCVSINGKNKKIVTSVNDCFFLIFLSKNTKIPLIKFKFCIKTIALHILKTIRSKLSQNLKETINFKFSPIWYWNSRMLLECSGQWLILGGPIGSEGVLHGTRESQCMEIMHYSLENPQEIWTTTIVFLILKHFEPPHNYDQYFLIILLFQAITSIFDIFLENSFYYWTGPGISLLVLVPGSTVC